MSDKERIHRSACEDIKYSVESRKESVLKGRVGDGAVENPMIKLSIMDEVKELSAIKNMNGNTVNKLNQSGSVNILNSKKNSNSSKKIKNGKYKAKAKKSKKAKYEFGIGEVLIKAAEEMLEKAKKAEDKKGTDKTYVTKQNLIDIGWSTDPEYLNDMVKELNPMLFKYGITEPEQIYHFLSQVMVESDNWYKKGLGDGVVEIGSDSYISGKYEGSKNLGNTKKGDDVLFKGAGYLHLTGRSNYTDFYNYMKSQGVDEPEILSKGYKCVSEKYACESAAWYWSIARPLNETSLKKGTTVTRTVNDNGKTVTVTGNSTVFDVTKLVNGGTNGIVDRMKYHNLVKRKIKF